MHPLRDTLPSLEIAHGPIQSSVHRMRASAPAPRSLTELMNILPRFASGEIWETLQRDFPGIQHYVMNYGISRYGINTLLKYLDTTSMDHLIVQVKSRINILCSGEFRTLALETLETTVATARASAGAGTETQETHLEDSKGMKEDKEFYKQFIRDLLKIIDRLEAGEPIFSLAETIPSLRSFIGNDGFKKTAATLLKNIKPKDKERIELAFTRRRQSLLSNKPPIKAERPARKEKPAAAPSKIAGVLRVIFNDPKLLIDISKRFSNPSNSISDEVCDNHITLVHLRKIVDTKTGELTPTGEQIVSQADASTQALIRANFRLRFQAAPMSATEAAAHHPYPSHGQYHAPPGDSFFSGVSREIRHMGYPEPETPQYPPSAPAFSDFGHYHNPHYGQPYAPPSDSFFSGFSGEVQRYQDPPTPQYPPASQAFSGAAPYYSPYYGQPYAPPGDSFFSGVSDEMRRKGYAEPETPQYPQSPTSTIGDLSSLNEGAYSDRDFDLNTPAEVTRPWPGDDHYSGTPAASSPERIDVDALPSPEEPSTPAARPSGPSETEWLGDEHLIAYMGTIAERLEGQPNAELLNFANPLLVGQLIQGDRSQRQNAMHQIMARGGPIIFLPVNDPNSHWSLLVIDQRNGDAFHYDSLVRPQDAAQAVETKQYELARDAARAMDVYTPVRGMPIARQRDGHSCGDHVLQAMDMLAHSVVNGTFGQPHTMDLSGIETDRGLIADTIANASAARTAEPAPAASRTHERPAKKSRKWWKF